MVKGDATEDEKDPRNKPEIKVAKNPFGFDYELKCKKKMLDLNSQRLFKGIKKDWTNYSQKLKYTSSGRISYNSPTEFNIGYFNHELPDDAFSGMVIGKRRTGKSHFTKDFVINTADRYDEIYIFTLSSVNDWYQSWIHKCYVFEGYQPDICEQIFQRALQKEMLYRKGLSKIRARILLICDDLLSDRHHKQDQTLEMLYTLGRHVDISVLYLSQKFKGLPPVFRDNSDIVVCFNMFNSNEARQLSEEFLGGLNIRTAQEMLDLYCSQKYHTCLVIETWRNCRDPEVFMKFYQAAPEEKLKISKESLGSKEYQQIAIEAESKNVGKRPLGDETEDIPTENQDGYSLT